MRSRCSRKQLLIDGAALLESSMMLDWPNKFATRHLLMSVQLQVIPS